MTSLGAVWALPFAGMLLSIALLPIAAPDFWHRHAGRVALGWSAAFLLPFAARFGIAPAVHALVHTLLLDYLPFILSMTALYTAAGGIHLRGDLRAGPGLNTALLALGALLASVIGTTGASMLLIRPLLRGNAHRPSATHVVVFFIFLVGNIGGALSPLGDPPLLIGFLRGVDFFWTTTHLLAPTLFLVACLLGLFFLLDTRLARASGPGPAQGPASGERLGVEGALNLLPLAAAVGLVLSSGVGPPEAAIRIAGLDVGLAALLRDAGLIGVILFSLAFTPKRVRIASGFSWAPMREVADLFVGLFVTMIPVLAMLQAGQGGAFAGLVGLVSGAGGEPRPGAYFWVTGLLSSFLDNAPTYLAFFEVAGGDARTLMTDRAGTLAAISAGAVFMGANTYVGNAPNLMIRAIAERHGVRMPGFFGYMAWSGMILMPLFAIVALIWFH